MERSSVIKEGLLLVNKPRGMTSHDVVDVVRSRLRMRRVGHAGTLDPLAEGLLIILVGRCTKLFSRFVGLDKRYFGISRLGEVTDTGDSQGAVIETRDYSYLNDAMIRETFRSFIGEQEQVPPMVSALRVNGQRLYKLARKGIVVNRQPRKITIYDLQIMKIDLPLVEFTVRCSKGTYIRKLAEDVGVTLGCGAHMVSIKRVAIGPYHLHEAINIDQINENYLRPMSSYAN